MSLYNETSGSAILPTPVIGGVGLIADAAKAVDLALKRDGNALILIGDTSGHLGASLYLREIEGREDGPPPPVDLAAERRNGDFVRGLIERRLVAACHDVSDGGLLVAIAEMAMAGEPRRRARPRAVSPAPNCLVVRRGPGALSRRNWRARPPVNPSAAGRGAGAADRHSTR